MGFRLLVSLVISMLLLSYLGLCLLISNPMQVDSIWGLPINTQVKMTGNPEKIKYSEYGVNFNIGEVEIRARGMNSMSSNITVLGYVSSYHNITWVQALKVQNAP